MPKDKFKKKYQMHPRNIFRKPPDYTDLAIKYKEFRQICKLELTGKVSIKDYNDEASLRALTRTLLLEYFQLNVEFAPQSLVPTLPLRLNYILWIEDLLQPLNVANENVHGIDIGCGSSCIYSLLAARKNAWHMVALETNVINLEYATENVQRNELQQLVHVHQQQNKQLIFSDYFASLPVDASEFQFCLCNPPFYDSNLPDPFGASTRNPERRPPPRNCHTGMTEELACEGGEVAFVQRIIEESLLYPNRVSIFTTMLGHKKHVPVIKAFLNEKGINNQCTTEFCQGNTVRWGVAWSFRAHVQLGEKEDVG